MVTYVNLRKTGTGWEFENEDVLEDFVWANLTPLFGLTPLKRQYIVNEQRCDILALDENRQLVVLELKNVEDRYVVQQLTRYYDVLREEKPFSEQIDYDRPIGLIAIAPSFHKDNFRDRKYCHLDIEFLHFEILVDGENFHFQLKDVDNGKLSQVEIPHRERESTDNIPSPPRALIKLLAKCTSEQKEGILEMREKILRFDRRIQETESTASINYGRGKSKPCAELRFDSVRNSPALFLWLPLVSSGWKKKNFTARMRVWTNWKFVSDVGHVPEAFGRMISIDEWKTGNVRPLADLLPNYKEDKERFWNDPGYRERYVESYKVYYQDSESYKSPLAMSINYYIEIMGGSEELNNLEALVALALRKWLEKL